MKISREWKIKLVLISVVIAVTLIATYLSQPTERNFNKLPYIHQDKLYEVSRVLDGDTFEVKVGTTAMTVRMLGIDTPETLDPRKPIGCYGKQASQETKDMLEGRSVTLKLNPGSSITDKYDRVLAYVYRDDGLFVNEYLLENGFAREYTYNKPYKFQKEFRALEKKAQEKGEGLWKACITAP